jgi:hypothetical protein
LANCFSDGNGIVTFEVTDHGEPSGTNSTEDEAAIHVKDKNKTSIDATYLLVTVKK